MYIYFFSCNGGTQELICFCLIVKVSIVAHIIADEKMQGPQFIQTSAEISPQKYTSDIDATSVQDSDTASDGLLSFGR